MSKHKEAGGSSGTLGQEHMPDILHGAWDFKCCRCLGSVSLERTSFLQASVNTVAADFGRTRIALYERLTCYKLLLPSLSFTDFPKVVKLDFIPLNYIYFLCDAKIMSSNQTLLQTFPVSETPLSSKPSSGFNAEHEKKKNMTSTWNFVYYNSILTNFCRFFLTTQQLVNRVILFRYCNNSS